MKRLVALKGGVPWRTSTHSKPALDRVKGLISMACSPSLTLKIRPDVFQTPTRGRGNRSFNRQAITHASK